MSTNSRNDSFMGSIAGRLSSLRSSGRGGCSNISLSLQKPVLLEKGYCVMSIVASGGQGEVLKASRREVSSPIGSLGTSTASIHSTNNANLVSTNIVAIKYVRCQSDEQRQETMDEVNMLKLVAHPNVVELQEVIEDRSGIYVVTEFLNGGDLLDRIQKGAFSEAQVLYFAEKALSILSFMHDLEIFHRDLKLENFMIHKDPATGEEIIKLIDFGMACRIRAKPNAPECLIYDEHPGTLNYEPPEIVRREPYRPDKVDIWCMGVMLYSALTKNYPFQGDTKDEIRDNICNAELQFDMAQWVSIGEPFRKLVARMLEKDPKKRPTATEVLVLVKKIRNNGSVTRLPSDRQVSLTKKDSPFNRYARSFSRRFSKSKSADFQQVA